MGCGTAALHLSAAPIKDDGPRQISRSVDVEPLLQACVEPQQLAGDEISSQPCQFGAFEVEFNEEIRLLPGGVVGLVSNHQGRCAEALDLLQNFAFRRVPRFRKKKSDKGFRPYDRLGAVAEFQRVKHLRIRAGHSL